MTKKTTEGKEAEQAAKMCGQSAFAACGASGFISFSLKVQSLLQQYEVLDFLVSL
jgi:hypothetical protein